MRILFHSIFLFILIALGACAGPAELVTERIASPPKVRILSAELTRLTFEDAEILFDVGIDNSNPISLTLLGFDYDLIVEDNSFIKGKQEGEITIEPRTESIIPFPLSFEFENLFRTFKDIVEKDSISYTLKLNLFFRVPMLRPVQIPVKQSGEIPIPKIPTIAVHALKIEYIDLNSADLVLDVIVENPNMFAIDISKLHYNFSVDQLEWASGETGEISLPEKKTSTVEIPINLDFLKIGRSMYRLISGSDTVSYSFNGEIDFSTSFPLLDPITLPFEYSGKIEIVR